MSKATQIETKYNCTVPTKIDADLFVMLGTSLMNGYAAVETGLNANIITNYFPTGDQTYAQRFGTTAQTYATPINNKGQFLYVNKDYNYDPPRFGPDQTMLKAMTQDLNWDRPLFLFHYEQNGASIIAGETTPSWAIADNSTYTLMTNALKQCISNLKSRGYNLRISIIWGSAGVTSTTDTVYRDSILALIAEIKIACEDNTIKFLWGKPTVQSGAAQVSYRNGVDLVCALDSNVQSFDYDLFIVSGDKAHPTTEAVLDQGLIFAGYWYEKYYGATRPTVSNIQITGTLKAGQTLNASYTYSGNEQENTTVVSDIYRLTHGTGTRIQWFVADDANGTNIDYYSKTTNKGETVQIFSQQVGKYMKVVVFSKASNGNLFGYPVSSDWFGPVIA